MIKMFLAITRNKDRYIQMYLSLFLYMFLHILCIVDIKITLFAI